MQSNAICPDWGNSGSEAERSSLIRNGEVQFAARFGLSWKDRGDPTPLSRGEVGEVGDLRLRILSNDVASKRIHGADSFAAHGCARRVGDHSQRESSDSSYDATREEDIARCIDPCRQSFHAISRTRIFVGRRHNSSARCRRRRRIGAASRGYRRDRDFKVGGKTYCEKNYNQDGNCRSSDRDPLRHHADRWLSERFVRLCICPNGS
jgi:hypothetical protein